MLKNWDWQKETKNFDSTSLIMVIFLLALISPIILLLLIKYTGYSEIIEEIFKALVVLFLILRLPTLESKIVVGLSFALLFSLSENMFYLDNIFRLGNLSIFVKRFVWTMPMHLATTMIILCFGLINKKLIIVGLFLAIFLHLLFNNIIVKIIVG